MGIILEEYVGEWVRNQQCDIRCFAAQQSEANNSHKAPKPIVEESFIVV